MKEVNSCILDDDTIRKIGLRLSEKEINAQVATNSRVFEYPHLENVFIMESDLYGNRMPAGSCFLAFDGKHGLIGKHITVDTLLNSSVTELRHIVESHIEG